MADAVPASARLPLVGRDFVLYCFIPLVLRYPFGLIGIVSGELGFLGYVFLLVLALQVLFDLVVYLGVPPRGCLAPDGLPAGALDVKGIPDGACGTSVVLGSVVAALIVFGQSCGSSCYCGTRRWR